MPLASALLLCLAAGGPARAAAAAPPERLDWPLEYDDGLAASFGELRGDRLHAGIDLRTRGETGFPVHAAAAGEVVRLKEEWRGYGLALYLRHAHGRVTVYAHLERVAPDLEERLAAARRARGSRWAGDVEVSPARPAGRGEVIAWSGESGTGLPHLHFELREGMERPVDPFAAGLVPPRDAYPPVAEQLVLEPAGRGARVNGLPEPRVVELRGARGRYTASERPVVTGPVRLTLRAYDRAGAENWTGVGGLRVTLDGREVYRVRLDALPFGEIQAAGALLDLARSHLGPSWYAYRLTRLEGADPGFARGPAGPLRLEPGLHRLEVELSDAVTTLGARGKAVIDLVARPPAEPAPAGGRPVADADVLAIALEPRGDALSIHATTTGGPGDLVRAWLGPAPLALARRSATRFDGEADPVEGAHDLRAGLVTTRVALAAVRPERSASLELGGFTLRLGPGDAYAPVLVAAREIDPPPALPGGLALLAPAVRLAPDGHPLRRPAEVAFALASPSRRAGIYRLDPADGSWDIEDMGTSCRVRRLASYALLEDRAPPVLHDLSPAAGAEVAGATTIEARVTDLGSGIAETGVSMWVDGQPLDVLYDPDRDRARARFTAAAGAHELKVRAEDRAGNAIERSARFRGSGP